ncbi:MAG TPA: ribosomal protein S18-alanine N-acetyltransferase [Candidatus Cloacimonadota bacterium]|nr:ribosomal protein S18-alanine N-acetyltransferase [Candidatus Cloacimonadota bacterium]
MDPILRQFKSSDIPDIITVENRAFPDPWPPEAFTGLLDYHNWILELDGKLIGYIMYHFIMDEAVILNFAIDPDYTDRGFGGYLLNGSLSELIARGCRRVFLDVRKSNLVAIGLYKKNGFEELGIRKDYYRHPPEDALVMGKALS